MAEAAPVPEDPVRKNLAAQMEEATDADASSSKMRGHRDPETDRRLLLATKALEGLEAKNRKQAEFQQSVTEEERIAADRYIETADAVALKELLDRATARYVGLQKAG